MKVKLKINVEGVGKHGETVSVSAALGKWLIDGRYATEDDTPDPTPAKKTTAKKAAAQSVSSKVASADAGAGR